MSVKITLALRALLQRAGLADARGFLHGKLGEFETLTGVNRHTIQRLCRGGNLKGTHLETIEKICTGLQPHLKGLSPDQIVKELVGAQQSSLLEEIAKHGLALLCTGQYVRASQDGRPHQWIAPNDAKAQTVLVQGLSSLPQRPMLETLYVPFHLPDPAGAYLNASYRKDLQEDKEVALAKWHELTAASGRAIWVLLGSMRTNFVVEYMISELFGVRPFEPADQWRVPFFLCYREWDHRVQSSFGDFGCAPPGHAAPAPGLYYRDLKGWHSLPWKDQESDAGLVVIQRSPQDRLEGVALFGFSGWATVRVSRLATQTNTRELFGPPYTPVRNGRSVGVFACRLNPSRDKDVKVIRLSDLVLRQAAENRAGD